MSTVILTDQGFRFENGAWQPPKPSPVPKARFNAQIPGAELTTNGRVAFEPGVKNNYPRVKVPGHDLHGFKVEFKGNPDPAADVMRELRYKILQPSAYTAEVVQFVQAPNFKHRQFWEITLDGEPTNWEPGQPVKTPNATGTLRRADKNKVWITDTSANLYAGFGVGLALTNEATGETFTITRRGFEPSNNKFSAQWVGRYSNGGLVLEYAKDYDDVGSYIKANISSSYIGPVPYTDDDYSYAKKENWIRNSGDKKNQLPGQPEKPPLLHPDDNGKLVNIGIERIRDKTNGGYRIWKSIDDPDFERMELIFESLGHKAHTTVNGDKFEAGYLFGWSNSGFDEDTAFYLTDWQLWFDRPPFFGVPQQ